MKYKEFIEFIIKIKDFNLKGKLAHKKMAPYNRISENEQNKINNFTYKEAAVLILIYPSDKGVPCFVLIERTISSGVHSGQISLPGGKKEKNDKSFWDTSIRETNEEIGVNLSKINFLSFQVRDKFYKLKCSKSFSSFINPSVIISIYCLSFICFKESISSTG